MMRRACSTTGSPKGTSRCAGTSDRPSSDDVVERRGDLPLRRRSRRGAAAGAGAACGRSPLRYQRGTATNSSHHDQRPRQHEADDGEDRATRHRRGTCGTAAIARRGTPRLSRNWIDRVDDALDDVVLVVVGGELRFLLRDWSGSPSRRAPPACWRRPARAAAPAAARARSSARARAATLRPCARASRTVRCAAPARTRHATTSMSRVPPPKTGSVSRGAARGALRFVAVLVETQVEDLRAGGGRADRGVRVKADEQVRLVVVGDRGALVEADGRHRRRA